MDNWEEEYEDLEEAVYDAPRKEKLAMCRRMIDLADSNNDLERGMAARLEFIEAVVFLQLKHLALPHFWWCLKQLDADPERFAYLEHELLWRYKWLIPENDEWLHIQYADVMKLHQDMVQRMKSYGEGAHAIAGLEISLAMGFGHIDQLEALMQTWKGAQIDSQSDCPACLTHRETLCNYYLNRHEAVITVSTPLRTGQQACEEVPIETWPFIAESAAELQNEVVLQECFVGMSNCMNIDAHGGVRGSFLWLAALLNKTDQARTAMRQMLDQDVSEFSDYYQLMYAYGISAFLRRLQAAGNSDISSKAGMVSIASLLQDKQAYIQTTCAQFDARNGNNTISQRFANMTRLLNQRL